MYLQTRLVYLITFIIKLNIYHNSSLVKCILKFFIILDLSNGGEFGF